MEDSVKKYLDEVAYFLKSAKCGYEMWMLLEGKETFAQYENILHHYQEISRWMRASTFEAMIIALFKVTDKKSYNVYKLLEILEENSYPEELLGVCKKTLESHAKSIKAVTILRHNVVAHLTVKLSRKDVFKKAGVKPIELKQYMDELIEVVDKIYYHHQRVPRTAFFAEQPAKKLEQMLKDLKAYHQECAA